MFQNAAPSSSSGTSPHQTRARFPDDATCLHCRYLLRGLTQPRCPECGERFNPADERTYRSRLRPRRRKPLITLAALAAPPTKPYIAFVFWLCAGLLWVDSAPGAGHWLSRHRRSSVYSPLIGVRPVYEIALMIIFVDVVRRFIAIIVAHRRRMATVVDSWRQQRSRYLAVALVPLLVCAWLEYPWPQAVQFYANRAALQNAADEYLAGRRGTPVFENIGSVHVHYIHGRGSGYAFIQTDCDDEMMPWGFVYDPNAVWSGGWWIAPNWYFRRVR